MNEAVIVLLCTLVISWATSIYLMVHLVKVSSERARLGRALRDAQVDADLWRNACQRTTEKLEAMRQQRALGAQMVNLETQVRALNGGADGTQE